MNTVQIPIFFFSGTGNTWWVGEKIAEGLRDRKFSAATFSIEQLDQQKTHALITEAEIIGLGYPIYGSDAPRVMKRFIDQLPHLTAKKQVLIYVTQMAWSGNGAIFLHRQLEKKNYDVCWAVEFIMPNNISIPFPMRYSADYQEFIPQLKQRKKQVNLLCDRIAANQSWIQGNSLFSTAIAWIQRGPFRLLHDWGQNISWSIDEDHCSQCGRCVRNCPTENISMDADSFPIFSDQCIYCMRCYNYCPENAVKVFGKRINQKRRGKPFQGPVPEFKPEMITRKQSPSTARKDEDEAPAN